MMHALIDADGMIWGVLTAANHNNYLVDSGEKAYTFRRKADAVAKADELGIPKEYIQSSKNEEPLNYVLSSLKRVIEKSLNAVAASSYALYIGGTGNYRKEYANLISYKGSRSVEKPHHWDDAVEYLIKNWGCEVVNNAEVDDMVSCELYADQSGSVVIYQDKDLLNTPGWHYNWKRDHLFWLDQAEADYNFYTQMLTGDKSDEVPGIHGIGPKGAAKYLKDAENTYDLYCAVKSVYMDVHKDKWEEWLTETAMMLWIQREPGVLWTPPLKPDDDEYHVGCVNYPNCDVAGCGCG